MNSPYMKGDWKASITASWGRGINNRCGNRKRAVREFVVAAICGQALQARLSAGHKLVPPLRYLRGGDPRLPGDQVEIFPTQHP